MTIPEINAAIYTTCGTVPNYYPAQGRAITPVRDTYYLSGSPLPALCGVYTPGRLYIVLDDKNRLEPVTGEHFVLSWWLRRGHATKQSGLSWDESIAEVNKIIHSRSLTNV